MKIGRVPSTMLNIYWVGGRGLCVYILVVLVFFSCLMCVLNSLLIHVACCPVEFSFTFRRLVLRDGMLGGHSFSFDWVNGWSPAGRTFAHQHDSSDIAFAMVGIQGKGWCQICLKFCHTCSSPCFSNVLILCYVHFLNFDVVFVARFICDVTSEYDW